jgi:hypothetical protein
MSSNSSNHDMVCRPVSSGETMSGQVSSGQEPVAESMQIIEQSSDERLMCSYWDVRYDNVEGTAPKCYSQRRRPVVNNFFTS